MPLSLRPAQESDASQVARVNAAAFATNALNSLLFPVRNGAATDSWLQERATGEILDPRLEVVVVSDKEAEEGQEIVAYARWSVPRGSRANENNGSSIKEDGEERSQGQEHFLPSIYPEGTNIPLYEYVCSALEKHRGRYADYSKDYTLLSLATHPSHQGKGCASLLLQHGIQRADAEKARCHLEATTAGNALYKKFGWKVVDEMRIPLGEFGGEGTEIYEVMVREPVFVNHQ